MSFYKLMIDKLIGHLKKPNIKNLFSSISKPFDEIDATLNKMMEWRDVDNACGTILDKLGSEIVQEFRNGETDEQYRMRIKIKIIANLSKGDIPTINKVLHMFFGDKLIGVREMWSLDDSVIPKEPAAILITAESYQPFPIRIIGRVVAGGITIYWHIILKPREVIIKRDIAIGKSDAFLYCGEFYSGSDYDPNTNGISRDVSVRIAKSKIHGSYVFPDLSLYSGEITNSTRGFTKLTDLSIERHIVQSNEPFKFSGDDLINGVVVEKQFYIYTKSAKGNEEQVFTGDYIETFGTTQEKEINVIRNYHIGGSDNNYGSYYPEGRSEQDENNVRVESENTVSTATYNFAGEKYSGEE